GDPVQLGLVASLNRPGGNLTGFNDMNVELGSKRLGLLHELLPRATRFAVLANPINPYIDVFTKDAQSAAETLGLQVEVLLAANDRDIDAAFATIVQKRADALLVMPDLTLNFRRPQI